MKRISMLLMFSLVMTMKSHHVFAQSVTITLMPGWNWISVPMMDTLDFETALGSFTPAVGDMIKSQWSNASYRADGHWRGQISHFYPGYGYKYYSNRVMPVTVTFNAQQPTPHVVVTTSEPMMVTGNSAMGGGNVTVSDGTYILVRGLCWATHENPTTNEDSFLEEGSGVGSFTATMTGLNISTTYYVRAYAVTANSTVYGEQQTFTTRDGIPTLTTTDITNIPGGSATSGGDITDDGGLNVMARGVCWSTNPNPTLNDSHSSNGTGSGSFTSNIPGLDIDVTYYVRAYATTNAGTAYGNEVSFTTIDYIYVDLGLPSGLLWATCNVGADNPEDYGDYFAWGETQPKEYYSSSNYQYCMGNLHTMTKYCTNADYGNNGFVDNLTTLEAGDDAATANWGGGWRMPTKAEWQELLDNTTVTWTTQNGVNGRLFTASNGNSLFLPAAGNRYGYELSDFGGGGHYWSSSLVTDYPDGAWNFYFSSGSYGMSGGTFRCNGHSVRAVRVGSQNNAPTGAIDGKFTINENGDQVYFSQGNLQYQASTNTWRFAENQYDYVGSDNSNISSTYDGWIDLFGWGTSGYNHGANCYQPWSTSTSYSNYYAYGNYQYNLYDQTGQADWGYNPINNGGNTAIQWRTLSQPEWSYIFNTRTTTSGIRYAKANVNNVNGVILLPDDWSTNTYSLSRTNTYNASFSSNTLTASQWSTLEQAGAVFLPAAGYRYGTSVGNVGSPGSYWSASYNNGYCAYCVHFSGTYLDTYDSDYRCYGVSVRLVRVAEN